MWVLAFVLFSRLELEVELLSLKLSLGMDGIGWKREGGSVRN
jgi:hypothetical protein